MENIQTILDQINSYIKEERSEEDIFQLIFSSLSKDPERDEKFIELLSNITDIKIAHVLFRILTLVKEKRLKKMIRRALYRLKSKGILIEEIPKEGESILKPLHVEPPKAFINNYDFIWDRILIVALPTLGKPTLYCFGLINDEEGLVKFGVRELSKKGFTEFFEDLKKGSSTPLIEIDAPYGAYLLSEAYQLSIDKGNLSRDFSHFIGEIKKIKKNYEKPLVYSYLFLGEIEKNIFLQKSDELFNRDIFKSWYINEELIRPYANELLDAEKSKLILNETQKKERFQMIYEKALFELFSEDRRLLFKRRLEETSYFLLKLGMEEEAKISLAVAMEIEKPLNRLQPNSFLLQLVINSIYAVLEDDYEKRSRDVSLIVRP